MFVGVILAALALSIGGLYLLMANRSRIKRLWLLARSKSLKAAWHYVVFYFTWVNPPTWMNRLLHRLDPYPWLCEIEVTTACNLRCTLCEHTYWKEPVHHMSFEQFKSIIDQFPHLVWIGLTGIGESFLNKDFVKMLAYVTDREVFVELYDTFYFIDDALARHLINMKVDRLFASIDGASKEVYEKIRVGSDFERVTGNVRRLAQLKHQQGALYPQIDFHFVVTKDNVHEMPLYIQMVHDLVGEFEAPTVQFTQMLHEFEEIKGLFVQVPQEIQDETAEEAARLGVKVVFNADVPVSHPSIKECKEWIMPFIFVTGHVIPCCAGNEAGHRDFQKETALGNVFEQSFRDIWYSHQYKAFRRALSRGGVPVQCSNCCLYDTRR